jgi:hypothetical protein
MLCGVDQTHDNPCGECRFLLDRIRRFDGTRLAYGVANLPLGAPELEMKQER